MDDQFEGDRKQPEIKKPKVDQRWWDLKLTGFMPPRDENRIIFYALVFIILMTLFYIAKFYFNK